MNDEIYDRIRVQMVGYLFLKLKMAFSAISKSWLYALTKSFGSEESSIRVPTHACATDRGCNSNNSKLAGRWLRSSVF